MLYDLFLFYSGLVWNVYAIEESSAADLYRDMVNNRVIRRLMPGWQRSFMEIDHEIQPNLVISNSLISNYHLSRSENLVPVLT